MILHFKKFIFLFAISLLSILFLIYGKYIVLFGHLFFYSSLIRFFFVIGSAICMLIMRKMNVKTIICNKVRSKNISTYFQGIYKETTEIKRDIDHIIQFQKINKKTIFLEFSASEKPEVSISEGNMLRFSCPGSIKKIKLFYIIFIINFILRSFKMNIIYLNPKYSITKMDELSFIRFNPFVKVIQFYCPVEDEKHFLPITQSTVDLTNYWTNQVDYFAISIEYEKYKSLKMFRKNKMRILFKNNKNYSIINCDKTGVRCVSYCMIFFITILFLYYGSILNKATSINQSLNLSNEKIYHFSDNKLNQLNNLINQRSILNYLFAIPYSLLKNKMLIGVNQFYDSYLSNELNRCSQKLKEEGRTDFLSYLSIRLLTKQNQIPIRAILNYYDENGTFDKVQLSSDLPKDLTGLIQPVVLRNDISYEELLFNEMLIDAFSRHESAFTLASKQLSLPWQKGTYYFNIDTYNQLIKTRLASFCDGVNSISSPARMIEFKKIDKEKFFSQYDQSYIMFWDRILSSIHFHDLSSESDLILAYHAIGKNHEYENFLRDIYNNTFLMMDKRNRIYQHYEFLYPLFKGGRVHSDSVNHVISSLIQCEAFLSDLMHDEKKQIKSYELLSSSKLGDSNPYAEFVSSVDKLPIQIQPIFRQLIQATNNYLLRQALCYLNSKWKNELFSPLKSSYSNSFPFVFDSKEGGQFKSFNAFISNTPGLLNLMNQLGDFLEKFDHELKSETFSHFISPSALVQARAFFSLLKTGFFEKEGCLVKLTPRYLSSNSQRVEMNFSEKYFDYQHGPELAVDFEWSKQSDVVIISFQDFRNQVHSKEFQGELALFQFLKSSRCKNLRPGALFCQYLQDSFEFDYEVVFDNPMIQAPLFALPESLLEG